MIRSILPIFLAILFLNSSTGTAFVGSANGQTGESIDIFPISINSLFDDDDEDLPESIEGQTWAMLRLSKQGAAESKKLLWEKYAAQIKRKRSAEWENKLIKIDNREMKFEFKTFGEPTAAGRSLFISMHGGGAAAARVNEQQWKNQIGLYEPDEGIYLAPRAPTNTWNLWHESHIDEFFERLIQDAVAFEGVDPNRVYIMGYSAGGDGVYQLAPRMADRWAAAAMMAGHPNDASASGLRNIGFTLHMGADDSAYKRNQVAAEWKGKLADLQASDPEGYKHEVVIHEGKGHWMDRQDAVAVDWMAEFTRDPLPAKVIWHQSGVTHEQFYWLAVNPENAIAGASMVASREGQTITIESSEGINHLVIRLNDDLLDLDQPVIIKVGDREVFRGKPERTASTLYKTMRERGDANLMFSAEIEIDVAQ